MSGIRLTAREANTADESLLRGWRNDPDTRRLSRTVGPISVENHREWLRESLDSGDRLLLIVEDPDGSPVGVVRWDRLGLSTWEISITVAPSSRGRGTARPLIAVAETALTERVGSVRRLIATIHQDNVASIRVFAGAGYLADTLSDASGFASFVKTLTGD